MYQTQNYTLFIIVINKCFVKIKSNNYISIKQTIEEKELIITKEYVSYVLFLKKRIVYL
jgi:hypothetical protein